MTIVPIEDSMASLQVHFQDSQEKTNLFDQIPSEIHRQIFLYLDNRALADIASTCRSFGAIICDPNHWKERALVEFPAIFHKFFNSDGSTNWLEVYQRSIIDRKELIELSQTEPDLYAFYQRHGVVDEPSKSIEPDFDIESLQGLYGIDLDEVGVDYWLKNNGEPVSLAPYIDALIAAKYDPFLFLVPHRSNPLSLTYRDAFKYVITRIKIIMEMEYKLDFSKPLKARRMGLFSASCQAYIALANIMHSRPEQAVDVPRRDPPDLSWWDVICQVLKDKGFIFRLRPYGVDTLIQQ